MPWSSSGRRKELPRDWTKRRARLLRDQPTCTCPGCPDCTGRPCRAPSTDADHLGDPADHDDLGAKCHPCHDHRTQQQATAARAAGRARGLHPIEVHPGLSRAGSGRPGATTPAPAAPLHRSLLRLGLATGLGL